MSKLLQELERLNVTLGAIRDVISDCGTNTNLEDVLDELGDNVVSLSASLLAEGGDRSEIDRLVRLNRELAAQLDAVRNIVSSVSDDNDG